MKEIIKFIKRFLLKWLLVIFVAIAILIMAFIPVVILKLFGYNSALTYIFLFLYITFLITIFIISAVEIGRENMADKELVIKIPEEVYEKIQKRKVNQYDIDDICQSVFEGRPLPKGYGKLIDADELAKEIKSYITDTSNLHYDDLVEAEAYNSAYYNCLDEIEDATPIIEADKSKSEGENADIN